jgi:hypothetical protein
MQGPLNREVLADGGVSLSAADGRFTFQRLRPGALLVTMSGQDSGQFGTAALDEIRMEIMRYGALELLVDAGDAVLVSTEVSAEWTRFFSTSRAQLKRVSVLTGSKLINLTVAIAQHLSQTGNLIQIYSDRELFDDVIARARLNPR